MRVPPSLQQTRLARGSYTANQSIALEREPVEGWRLCLRGEVKRRGALRIGYGCARATLEQPQCDLLQLRGCAAEQQRMSSTPCIPLIRFSIPCDLWRAWPLVRARAGER